MMLKPRKPNKWTDFGSFLESENGVKINKDDFHLLSGRRVMVDIYGYIQIDGKRFRVHSLVCPSEKGNFTDHINRDKLDNRRENLRSLSISLSNVNKTNKVPKTSRFRGVCKWRYSKGEYKYEGWRATICLNHKQKTIGSFKTEEEAAIAYNAEAVKLHGDVACLNVIT